jgi:hypothetical protein
MKSMGITEIHEITTRAIPHLLYSIISCAPYKKTINCIAVQSAIEKIDLVFGNVSFIIS